MSSSVQRNRFLLDRYVLNITKLNRLDAGKYSCQAINSEGSSSKNVHVSVYFAAVIVAVSENVTVNPNQDAIISCTADGNPSEKSSIKWNRDSFSDFHARTFITFDKNGTSFLRISNVTRKDLGNFQCTVYNGIGNSSTKNVMLIVKHKPEFKRQATLLKFAVDTGDTGKIICRSQASPIARYKWERNGSLINTAATEKYSTTYRRLDALTSESALAIKHTSLNDYGIYKCIAQNEFGASDVSLFLKTSSVPDPPLQFRVLKITKNFVTLGWTPGFDGGMKCFYRIRYRKVNEQAYKYIDLTTSNATEYTIDRLDLNVQYMFSLAAVNKLGNSKYLPDISSDKIVVLSFNESNLLNILKHPIIISLSVFCVTLLLVIIGFLIEECIIRYRTNHTQDQREQSSLSIESEFHVSKTNTESVKEEVQYSLSQRSTTNSMNERENLYVGRKQREAAVKSPKDGKNEPETNLSSLNATSSIPFTNRNNNSTTELNVTTCLSTLPGNICTCLCNSMTQHTPPIPLKTFKDTLGLGTNKHNAESLRAQTSSYYVSFNDNIEGTYV